MKLSARGCKRVMLFIIGNTVELEGFLDFVFVENHGQKSNRDFLVFLESVIARLPQ